MSLQVLDQNLFPAQRICRWNCWCKSSRSRLVQHAEARTDGQHGLDEFRGVQRGQSQISINFPNPPYGLNAQMSLKHLTVQLGMKPILGECRNPNEPSGVTNIDQRIPWIWKQCRLRDPSEHLEKLKYLV